jgi:uncharacterized membrane protein YadS
LDYLQRLLPGLLLCSAITIAATLLEDVEVYFTGGPYLESLVIAILLGVIVRTIWTPGPTWIPGIGFSAKFVLECAIVMLGALVSAATVFSLGFELIFGIAFVVSLTIGLSYAICRWLGLTQRLSILIACGNSICGNSAIAAIAPVIGAENDEIASSISFTAVLGVLVVLGLPLLVPVLHLSLTQYGVLAGLCGAASRCRHASGRRAEQPSRNADQAGACPDARAGRALLLAFFQPVAARRQSAQSDPETPSNGALVHLRLCAVDCDTFARPNPAEDPAGSHRNGHATD